MISTLTFLAIFKDRALLPEAVCACGDRAHGVARADGHTGRVGGGLLRLRGSAGVEALVDDRHDLVVVSAERVASLLAVAVVATDRGGGEGL